MKIWILFQKLDRSKLNDMAVDFFNDAMNGEEYIRPTAVPYKGYGKIKLYKNIRCTRRIDVSSPAIFLQSSRLKILSLLLTFRSFNTLYHFRER